ncbi:MAG: tyrosine-type recombinase/integrase [Oceanicoccus sp.]
MEQVKKIVSAKTLENLRLPEQGRVNYPDGEVKSLQLQLTSTGKKTWYLVARWEGKSRRFKPRNPDEKSNGHLPLSEIRTLTRSWKNMIFSGVDPEQVIKDAENNKPLTFGQARTRFFEEYVQPELAENTGKAYVTALKSVRLEAWIDKPISGEHAVTKDHIRRMIRKIATQEGRPTMSNRTLAYLRKFYNWCEEEGIVDDASLYIGGIKPRKSGEIIRERVLDPEEIKVFWEATEKLGWPFGHYMRFVLITGQRKSECAGIGRTNIKDGVWTQKGTKSKRANKANRTHTVPLPRLALDILEDCPKVGDSNLYFTTTGKTTISGFSRVKRRLDAHIQMILERDELEGLFPEYKDDDQEGWRNHDLRRTFATRMRDLRIDPWIVSALLNHAPTGVTGKVYLKHDPVEEKREAMEAWANYLESLVSPRLDSNVVCLVEKN